VGLFGKDNLRPIKDTRIVVRACELAALRAGILAGGIESKLVALRRSVSFPNMRNEAHTCMPFEMHLLHPQDDDMLFSVEDGVASSGFLCGSSSTGWMPS
jgi:hypothetical protein